MVNSLKVLKSAVKFASTKLGKYKKPVANMLGKANAKINANLSPKAKKIVGIIAVGTAPWLSYKCVKQMNASSTPADINIVQLRDSLAKSQAEVAQLQDSLAKSQSQVGEGQTKPTYDYVSPEIGKFGVVKTDTTYHCENNAVEGIFYLDKDNRVRQCERFDKDGILKEVEYNLYGPDGYRRTITDNAITGNTKYMEEENNKEITLTCYDNKGDVASVFVTNRKTGEEVGTFYRNHAKHSEVYYDKNDKKIKTKVFKDDETLDYTVTPKYDKDGAVLKNDTVYNVQ